MKIRQNGLVLDAEALANLRRIIQNPDPVQVERRKKFLSTILSERSKHTSDIVINLPKTPSITETERK
jgi:hypothetical protein